MRALETDPRVERIRAWAAEGRSFAWMGRQLGVTGSRVSQIAIAYGIQSSVPEADRLRELGRRVASWLREHPEVQKKKRHEEFDSRLGIIMWAAASGKTYGEAAKILGVSRNVVAGMAHRNGIKFGEAA
jgi:predicted metal-dependent hydrolase